jgi:GAF domain-containing protein
VLQLDRCRFDIGTEPVLATLDDAGAMTYDGRPYDVDRLGLPTDTEVALAVRSGGIVRGRFLLTAATQVVRPSPEQLRVAGALANQVGAALAAACSRGSSTSSRRASRPARESWNSSATTSPPSATT